MKFMCYVCGWPKLKADPREQIYEICPCCGVEFGYDDWAPDSYERHADLRQVWIRDGMPWHSNVSKQPEDWNPSAQLQSAKFPDLILKELKNLKNGWDTFNAPAPKHSIIDESHRILFSLMREDLRPNNILADAEGGVSFVYIGSGLHRAVIEATNDGQVWTLLYNLDGQSETRIWPANWLAVLSTITDPLRKYLKG